MIKTIRCEDVIYKIPIEELGLDKEPTNEDLVAFKKMANGLKLGDVGITLSNDKKHICFLFSHNATLMNEKEYSVLNKINKKR